MVKSKENLVGKVFERLTVLKQVDDYISPSGKHYAQWLCECSCEKHNKVIANTQNLKQGNVKSCGCISKKHNEYVLDLNDEYGVYGIGYCHNTNTEFYFDMDDYNRIKSICWCECTSGGIQRIVGTDTNTGKLVSMHIFLGYKWHDHIDRNELNNRKHNLRPATTLENSRNKNKSIKNTSGITGVSFISSSKKWRARVSVNRKEIFLGNFTNKEDAIKARLEAEAKYYKEFAPQRHLFEEYNIKSETTQN